MRRSKQSMSAIFKSFFALFILFSLALGSCKKENNEPETSAEYLAEDIQSVMTSENTTRLVCMALGDNFDSLGLSASSTYGTDYLFRDEIVFSEGRYYNLNMLVMYEIRRTSDDTKYMVLYF